MATRADIRRPAAPARAVAAALLLAVAAAGAAESTSASTTTTASATTKATATARVARVIDGDTLVLASGIRVRLLQIDTPEPGTGECYSRAAGRELRRLLPAGVAISLEADPALDPVDRYGRLLRYVQRGRVNVNLELVRRGAATVYFYRGDRGRYAGPLLAAAQQARAAKRGLWGACRAVWAPNGPATTGAGTAGAADTQPRPVAGGSCDPSYPDVCIPLSPPDLDCGDIPHRNFRVRAPDPHRFDGSDDDGRGCES